MELAAQAPSELKLKPGNAQVQIAQALDEKPFDFEPENYQRDYQVRVDNFEGPLDLLLHLIRKEQIDIYNIPIARICQSYLEYLELMQRFDVNIAGEFLVMAASLLQIKSQLLLPKEEELQAEDDPRLPLVAQLLEYERFKLIAQEFESTPWMGRDVFPRPAAAITSLIPKEVLKNAPIEPFDPYLLLKGLKSSLDRTERPPMEINFDFQSVKEKVSVIHSELLKKEVIPFTLILPPNYKVRDIILGFLAMLELAKLKFIEIIQPEILGPIQIRGSRSIEELDMALLDQY